MKSLEGKKPGVAGVVLGLSLRKGSGDSYSKQLYCELRGLILSGQLAPGQRLPSTRILGHEIGLSRNTVMAVYEQLQAEGYISSLVGSGSRVSEHLPQELLASTSVAPVPGEARTATTSLRSQAVQNLATARTTWLPAFSPGMPAIDQFPFATWSRLLAKEWKDPGLGALTNDPGGYWPLRENIANYVRGARGVTCDADQVIVLSGNREGTELAARVLLDDGEAAIVEDPGFPGVRSALAAAGVHTIPLRSDCDGLVVSEMTERHTSAKLVCVAPSHHYPLGGTTSLARRLALLEWCRRHSCWIIEDDYDSEFRYLEKPLPSLQSLDPAATVIYVGTFSKTLFPSLRIGYAIVPKNLIEPFVKMKVATTGSTTMVSQRAIARLMDSDMFYRHIRTMRKLYAERREGLVKAIGQHLPWLTIPPQQNAGLFLVTFFGEGLRGTNDVEIANRAYELGVHVEPLSSLYMTCEPRHGLIFGFGGLDESALAKPMGRLKTIIASYAGKNAVHAAAS